MAKRIKIDPIVQLAERNRKNSSISQIDKNNIQLSNNEVKYQGRHDRDEVLETLRSNEFFKGMKRRDF